MRKLFKAIFTLMGVVVGIGLADTMRKFLETSGFEETIVPNAYPFVVLGLYIFSGVVFTALFYFCSGPIISWCERFVVGSEAELRSVPMADILFACLGMLIGLLIAYLIVGMLAAILPSWLSIPVAVLAYMVLAYLGARLFFKRWKELPGVNVLLQKMQQASSKTTATAQAGGKTIAKVLDTSVIIDGRIFDICQTGFIDGPLIVPQFVLGELQHIADSSDTLKRNRGRRGLDVLQRIQKELEIEVTVVEQDFDDVSEVDVKLLKLAQALGGAVVTNDYNLNKVAGVSGIRVLNLNDLANALKPAVIPGEEMLLAVVKEGKEHGQGIAYLDDGTMIVIDSARDLIGEEVEVVVTSVLQTSAGRMIFARLKGSAA